MELLSFVVTVFGSVYLFAVTFKMMRDCYRFLYRLTVKYGQYVRLIASSVAIFVMMAYMMAVIVLLGVNIKDHWDNIFSEKIEKVVDNH